MATTIVRIEHRARCVEVVHRGTLTPADLEDARARAAALLEEHGYFGLIVDGRGADISALNATDTFDFSKSLADVFPAGTLRIALVIPEEHADMTRFAETVARNRGVNLRVFLDADEARRWLADAGG